MSLELFRDHAITEGLTDEELQRLDQLLESTTIEKGHYLFTEGQPTIGLICVTEGRLRVTKADNKGKEHKLVELEAPTVIGEMELITGQSSSASVIAETPIKAVMITHEYFEKIIGSGDPLVAKVMRNIARVIAIRMNEANTRFVSTLKPERAREFEEFKQKLVGEWNF